MLPPGDYWPRGHCDECGPLPPPYVHHLCHDCGHEMDDHTEMTLRCRVCKRECGVSVIVPDYVYEHGWVSEQPEAAPPNLIERVRQEPML